MTHPEGAMIPRDATTGFNSELMSVAEFAEIHADIRRVSWTDFAIIVEVAELWRYSICVWYEPVGIGIKFPKVAGYRGEVRWSDLIITVGIA